MSTYGNFINDALEREYILVRNIKTDHISSICLYEHKNSKKRLLKILSKNRNDHIFRKLRGLKGNNLPTIFDVCSCEEEVLVLEEYIEGETLAQRLEVGYISRLEAVNIALDVCKALSSLHELNIIHRDVKPSNIIITPENTAVLIDFSAARLMNEGQNKDTLNLGTVGYAAPEQFGVFQSMPPTDIYALGVMLNELVEGTHPSVKMPSGKLGKIIRKCTDTSISKRYQGVNVLANDLNRYKKFHKK